MTIVEKKWANRGFLYQPVLPIYGVGSVMCLLVSLYAPNISHLQIFLLGLFGSAVLEYSTAYILDRCFHAYWWDYSRIPLNINGWVSLPTACGFGFAAVLLTKYISKWLWPIVCNISPIGIEILGMVIVALIAADTTLTCVVLSNFQKRIVQIDASLNEKMEAVVDSIKETGADIKDVAEHRLSIATKSMSYLYRGTIHRIKGFRVNAANHNANLVALAKRAKELISEKVKNIKK